MTMHPSLALRAEQTLEAVGAALYDLGVDDLLDESHRLVFTLPSGASYLLNWHSVAGEIWMVSPLSGPSHYLWREGQWISTREEETLADVLSQELTQLLGYPISLSL